MEPVRKLHEYKIPVFDDRFTNGGEYVLVIFQDYDDLPYMDAVDMAKNSYFSDQYRISESKEEWHAIEEDVYGDWICDTRE